MRPAALGLVALALAAPAFARPTAVGVSQDEFRIALHREVVKTGRVKFNVTNRGEDPHDLLVRRRGKVHGRLGELRPGEQGVLRVRLRRPGRYTVVCTLADHEALGMRSVLRVRARD
jgi:plastocyanin